MWDYFLVPTLALNSMFYMAQEINLLILELIQNSVVNDSSKNNETRNQSAIFVFLPNVPDPYGSLY